MTIQERHHVTTEEEGTCSYVGTAQLVHPTRRTVIAVRTRIAILRATRFSYCRIEACEIGAAKDATGAITFGASTRTGCTFRESQERGRMVYSIVVKDFLLLSLAAVTEIEDQDTGQAGE